MFNKKDIVFSKFVQDSLIVSTNGFVFVNGFIRWIPNLFQSKRKKKEIIVDSNKIRHIQTKGACCL